MSLYHFHVSQIGRSKGHTAIAAAAYRSGQKLYDDYYGEIQDYTHKDGVIAEGILLPPYAPARYTDRQTLWTEVEYCEKHPRAQLCYSFDIALQNELTMEENIALAETFMREHFVTRGMICDYAIHAPDKGDSGIQNPHFHVLCPIRPLDENGNWGAKQRREYLHDDDGNRIRDKDGKYAFNSVPTTDWGQAETLDSWREDWAVLVNHHFAKKGLPCRIDHRSYKDQGLDLIPQIHEGVAVRHMERRGILTDKGAWNKWVKKVNTELQRVAATIAGLITWIEAAREELQKEKSPSLMECINDYYDHRNEVADTFEYGRQKAKSKNLQSRANMYAYLQENQILTPDNLENRIREKEAKIETINKSVKPMQTRIDELDNLLKCLKKYHKYLPLFEESQRILFSGKRKSFQNAHRKELNAFQKARRELEKILPSSALATATSDPWVAEIESLKEQIAEKLSAGGKNELESDVRKLKQIRTAVDYGLEKRGLKSNGNGARSEREMVSKEPQHANKRSNETLSDGGEKRQRASLQDRLAEKKAEVNMREEKRENGRAELSGQQKRGHDAR